MAPTAVAQTTLAQSAIAQSGDEPVGWPYRPPVRKPVTPMPAPAKPMPEQVRPDRQTEKPLKAEPTAKTGDDTALRSHPQDEIGPIERITLPVRPLGFTYENDRVALTRDETTRLRRMAERLRKGEDRIAITSWAPPQETTPRAGLETALTRALYVRSFLVHEGVPLAVIDLKALPADHPERPEDSPYGHLSVTIGGKEKVHSP